MLVYKEVEDFLSQQTGRCCALAVADQCSKIVCEISSLNPKQPKCSVDIYVLLLKLLEDLKNLSELYS